MACFDVYGGSLPARISQHAVFPPAFFILSLVRYRGVAVSVEDRDQTYSFVDVRDVVVLDPDVGCHPGCLLHGAVDAFQQQGWEFSVQVRHAVSSCEKVYERQRNVWRGGHHGAVGSTIE